MDTELLFPTPLSVSSKTAARTGRFREVIVQADADFRAPARDFKNPYYDTSPSSDAYVITSWCLYHVGHAPRSLAPSRGYTWKVDCPGLGSFTCKVRDPHNHRSGVQPDFPERGEMIAGGR
jgi:hypothetical protein